MSDLEYGVNVANKYDLLDGDEDPSEALTKAVQDPTKKKEATTILKEKPARSTGKPQDSKDGKKAPEGKKQDSKTRNVPAGQQQQRPPRTSQGQGRPEQGKENTSRPQRPEGQRTGGPRRGFGGPRPEGAPRRPDQDFGAAGGDQEVPEQRAGFGGRGGARGGSTFRGGRQSPRHQYPREQQETGAHGRGREYERHSGSNKTGVKSTQKREGGGAHNWGSYKDEVEAKPEESPQKPVLGEDGQPLPEQPEQQVDGEPKEPEVRELTLKEYMEEQESTRARPKFNCRQANEGESEQKVFQKMKRVQRESTGADGMIEVVEYVEVDVDHNQKGGCGGPFQLVFAPTQLPTREGERPTRGGPRGGARGGRGARQPQQFNQNKRSQAPPAADEANFPPLG